MGDGLNIKLVTPDNFRDDDPTIRHFVGGTDEQGMPRRSEPADWIKLFLALKLGPRVPIEVRDLHTVAKSAAGYGGLYYPMFTVAENQMARVGEAAVTHVYRACDGPPAKPKKFLSLYGRLRWLHDEGHISEDQRIEWDLHREWRNATTHADEQMLLAPGVALQSCERTSLAIGHLFA